MFILKYKKMKLNYQVQNVLLSNALYVIIIRKTNVLLVMMVIIIMKMIVNALLNPRKKRKKLIMLKLPLYQLKYLKFQQQQLN